jgi:ribosome-binding ATPase
VKVGIVGLPNAGKSTLFNALTRAGAQTGDYPFTTVEPNVAVAAVPDPRLQQLAETIGSSETVPETIEFIDIAGLVRGAAEGEGLGNRFLGQIRETDAICQVVRAHADSRVPHPDGRVDPIADIEAVETELLLSDLEQVERRLERVTKQARSGDKEAIAERDWLAAVRDAVAAGNAVRSVPVPDLAADAPRRLAALTSKPMLYVANVDEGSDSVPDEVAAHAAAAGATAVAVSARIEGELAELEGPEADEMRAQLEIGESGLSRVVRAAYELLDLITFFTADRDKEATARSLRRGSTVLDAAAKVHTDFQRDFVKAEVIAWDRLVEAGGYLGAQERGLLRIEGRDYAVEDGDVVTIKT